MKPIEELIDEIIVAGLDHQDRMGEVSTEELESIYNGCGPEWAPWWTRAVLTHRFQVFESAFLIHDYDFAFPVVRVRGYFDLANTRMLINCRKLIARAPWLLRPVLHIDALILYRAVCSKSGWDAFNTEPAK